MADNARPMVLDRAGFDVSFSGRPEIFRSLEKFSPKQNDFAKTIISAALQLENSLVTPRSIVIGGPLDPGQIAQISSFFSDETTVMAYVLTKSQMSKFLESPANLPAVFVFSSTEYPNVLDSFRSLASSLNKHSDQYGTRLLQDTYGSCKINLEAAGKGRGHSLVIEEKFGKIAVLEPDESTLKDRIKYFSRGGMDWRKSRDDRVYYENGWSIGSFMVCEGNADAAAGASRVRVESLDFVIEHSQKPSILNLKVVIDHLFEWIERLRKEKSVPDLSAVHYCIPSVPVIGWIADRLDRLFGRKLKQICPSLMWGWHPAADFTNFICEQESGSSLFIDMENFPRVSATLRYGAIHGG